MNSSELNEVRCLGCRMLIGLSTYAENVWIYHDVLCALDVDPKPYEARDALMEAMYFEEGFTVTLLGPLFGMSRQRADQIIKSRRSPHVGKTKVTA